MGDFTYKLNNDHSYNIPSWVQQLSFGGLIKPSSEKLQKIKIYNAYFEYHENSIRRGPRVVSKLTNKIKKKDDMPLKLIYSFCKCRTIIRINFNNYKAQNMKGSKRESSVQDIHRSKVRKLNKIIN